jgi:DedD protein
MAFFKFRMPAQTASTEAAAPGPNENLEVVRRRARHRLMGAVVLVLVAVVGFPLLFDTQPRPVAVDTPIVIPDRQSTPPLASAVPLPASQAPAKPLLPAPSPSPEAVSAQASLDAREEVVLPAASVVPVPVPKPAAVKETPPAEKIAEKAPEKPAVVKQEPKPVVAAKPKDDGNKAQALLEGKTAKPSAGRLVIQVGAFSDAAKVRDVRSKLEQAGVKTYTQTVEKDGKNTIRIRVGPYETKEEADKVAARIRKLDLPVSFLKI